MEKESKHHAYSTDLKQGHQTSIFGKYPFGRRFEI